MWKNLLTSITICLTAGFAVAQKDNVLTTNKVAAVTILGNPTTKPLKLEKGTYLGMAVSNVPASLRAQLQLKPGVGLIVDRVEKNSPAEEAGIKQYDIVEKLEDQWLINPQQFAVLVRMQQAGGEVKLSVIRQGQTQAITAKVIEKEVAPIAGANTAIWIHKEDAWNAEGLAELINLNSNSGRVVVTSPKNVMMSRQENGYEINLTRDGDSTLLKASDAAGNLLFEGPVNTEEEWNAVPPDVARVARKMSSDMKLVPQELRKKP